MGTMPFSLVYRVDVVLPIEVGIPTLRISLKGLNTNDDYRISRFQELELLDRHQQVAWDHLQAYQQYMSRSYQNKVKPHDFQLVDLILRETLRIENNRYKKGSSNSTSLVHT